MCSKQEDKNVSPEVLGESFGMMKSSDNFKVTVSVEKQLDLNEGVKFVSSSKCGAINSFLGTIRDTEELNGAPERICAIQYEAYEPMVLSEVCDIVDSVVNKPDSGILDLNSRAYVAIRLGVTPVQEAAIIICVSSTNRKCAHEATMSILKKIKSVVPIWKKIIYLDGREEWADAKSEAAWLNKKK